MSLGGFAEVEGGWAYNDLVEAFEMTSQITFADLRFAFDDCPDCFRKLSDKLPFNGHELQFEGHLMALMPIEAIK